MVARTGGCERRFKCLYKYNTKKNPNRYKVIKFNEWWEELKEESDANIQSEEGILKRQTRSIQTIGRNILKYRRFLHGKTKKSEEKIIEKRRDNSAENLV